MDPLSSTASAITVLGLLTQSTIFTARFLHEYRDASVEIKHYHTTLENFRGCLMDMQALYSENAHIIELTPVVSTQIAECMADFVAMEAKIRKARCALERDKYTRTWARLKWSLLSEQWFRNFFDRIQNYQSLFTFQLVTLQMLIPLLRAERVHWD